jgi:hypothetical protein
MFWIGFRIRTVDAYCPALYIDIDKFSGQTREFNGDVVRTISFANVDRRCLRGCQ